MSKLMKWGKWSGTPLEKVPPMEVLWLAANAPEPDIQQAAKDEIQSRGLTAHSVLLTYHAIDRFSQRFLNIYLTEREASEGIVSFLHRVADTAYCKRYRTRKHHDHYRFLQIRFVISLKNGIPVLKTIF